MCVLERKKSDGAHIKGRPKLCLDGAQVAVNVRHVKVSQEVQGARDCGVSPPDTLRAEGQMWGWHTRRHPPSAHALPALQSCHGCDGAYAKASRCDEAATQRPKRGQRDSTAGVLRKGLKGPEATQILALFICISVS